MGIIKKALYVAGVAMLSFGSLAANASTGALAPEFSATDVQGEQVSLSALKGKVVVLEWNNPECPFVKKFYTPGAMQEMQKDAVAKDVVWITINSSAAGKQGNLTAETAKDYMKAQAAQSSHYILDAAGELGKLYGAKTTPHMFVIAKDGTLAYSGAIDSKATANSNDIAGAKNYVKEALASVLEGKPVLLSNTQSYGCAIKY